MHGWIKKSYSGSWIAANHISQVVEVIVGAHVLEYVKNNPGISEEKAFKTISNWDVFKAIKRKGFLTWDSDLGVPVCTMESKKVVSAYLGLVQERVYVGMDESGRGIMQKGYRVM